MRLKYCNTWFKTLKNRKQKKDFKKEENIDPFLLNK